jgi:hypothetical protein
MHLPKLILLSFLSAAPAIAENTYYSIWPKANKDTTTNNQITNDLNSRVGDSKKVFVSKSDTLGNLYWYAPLSDADKAFFTSHAGVGHPKRLCR